MSRLTIWSYCLLLVVLCFSANAQGAEPDSKGTQFFETKIRPVLVAHCYKCHSAAGEKVKGGLLLDNREAIRRGGESGPAVVPGSLADSLLISALRHEDLEMPPGKKLPEAVIADFEAWIKMGAPDPRDGVAAGGGKRVIDLEEGRKFWAFQPVERPVAPEVQVAGWPYGEIDRFVLAGLESQQLQPVADAPARQLIRRIYFDLTGLPPTPADLEKWEDRLSPATSQGKNVTINQTMLATLVDELLASPRFGEHWGRHWLDVARYADSNGNADNTPFPHAWRYRNYVIDALNSDKPYDQFLREQIAGDLLPYDNPQQRNQQLVATGFLALGSKPRAQNNPNFQMDVVAEQIEVTTTAALGLTVACARCHDHKFDPIPTAEYYSLAGIFSSSRTLYGTGGRGNGKRGTGNGGLISLLSEDAETVNKLREQATERERLGKRQGELNQELARLGVTPTADGEERKQDSKKDNDVRRLQAQLVRLKAKQAPAAKIEQVTKLLAQLGGAIDSTDQDAVAPSAASSADKSAIKRLSAELAEVNAQLASLGEDRPNTADLAMGISEGSPADCAICLQGESTQRGEVVPRGFITVATATSPPTIAGDESGRLALANWIADARNPLTSRVIANRIWQHLMGRGIVATVDNFGELGERPTHPELLDWLSSQLVAEDWSIKRLARTIMLSRAYQLSSEHEAARYERDPDNVWHWRTTPRRLSAESFRDAILAFSGRLDVERPDTSQLPNYNPRQAPTISVESNCRSVYLPIIRNGEPESLALFDFADPSIVVGQREVTTVPSQALFVLNAPFVVAQAEAAAERILQHDAAKTTADRIDYAYRLAYARSPSAEQRQRAVDFLDRMQRALAEREPNERRRELSAWTTLCQSLIAAAEFRYLD